MFSSALNYIQKQLCEHKEKSHPAPMYVGALEQEQASDEASTPSWKIARMLALRVDGR